jgi:hypothetical protein
MISSFWEATAALPRSFFNFPEKNHAIFIAFAGALCYNNVASGSIPRRVPFCHSVTS